MKKKLLALAIAGAFVAPVAMADTANVNVYGIADVSYDYADNGDIVGTTGVTTNHISSNSSRLGFKGNEDLGSGLKAIWQIESAINIDNTGGTFATRNSFAGLSGDSWGSLTLGRNDTPYKSSTRGLDVFLDHIADNRTLIGGVGGKSSYTQFDNRFADTARYDSPDINGFKIAAAYTASAETNSVSTLDVKGRGESLSATYATGPFFAAAAYQKHTFGSTAGNVGAAAAGLTDEKAWKVGGSYKVDQFGVNAVYEKTTDSLGSAANGRGHKAYYVAGTFNATANDTIKVSYAEARDLQDGSATNTGADQWSVGVDHSLSKRTTVYAMYTKLDNDSAASYALSSAAVATGAPTINGTNIGADPSAFSIGIKHSF